MTLLPLPPSEPLPRLLWYLEFGIIPNAAKLDDPDWQDVPHYLGEMIAKVKAEAKLAAAPGLLAACERSLHLFQCRLDLCEITDSEKAHIDTLRNAIRKAKGA